MNIGLHRTVYKIFIFLYNYKHVNGTKYEVISDIENCELYKETTIN